jgi:predicted lysophospholipase L1 biosynthesis ABC-type transport system permease subunit
MALQVERNVLRERLVTYLAAMFGGLSLLLGCIGLYGVLSYSVARRTQELGVRLALGARPSDLTRSVLRDALGVAVAGTGAGLVVALWASGLLRGLLFQVTTMDPVVALASAVLLLAATLTASYFPARRAARGAREPDCRPSNGVAAPDHPFNDGPRQTGVGHAGSTTRTGWVRSARCRPLAGR